MGEQVTNLILVILISTMVTPMHLLHRVNKKTKVNIKNKTAYKLKIKKNLTGMTNLSQKALRLIVLQNKTTAK